MPTEHLPSEGESAESRTWRFGVQRPRAAPVALFCFLIALVGPVLFICLPLDDPNSIRDGAGLELDRVSGWVIRLAGSAFFLIIGGVLGTTAARAGLRTETITIDPECFIIEHSLFGRTRHQRYVRRLIGDLRVPDDVPGVADREGFNPAGGGALAFQHGGQTIFFGPETDRAAAVRILDQILDFAPDLATPTPVQPDQAAPADGVPTQLHADSPQGGRFVLEREPGLLRIIIPARSSAFSRMFMSAWLLVWVVSLIALAVALPAAISSLKRAEAGSEAQTNLKGVVTILSIFLCIWIPGGILALYSFVWSRWGRQIIEIESARITVSNHSPLWRSRREIDRTRCGSVNLRERVGNLESVVMNDERGDSGGHGGWLECRGRARRHHFGAGLTKRESKYLLERLRQIDPSLVKAESDSQL